MKTTGFRWRVLLIPVLCGFIATGAVKLYLSHNTTLKLRELDQSLQDPAWRDRFEADYKPAFDKLFLGDDATYQDRSSELTRFIRKHFPDTTGHSFMDRPAGYAVKLYYGSACFAYITADPKDHALFLFRTERIQATYPRFLLIRDVRE